MDTLIRPTNFHASCVSPCIYGQGDSVPVDQQSAQPFNIDPETGRPMSDLTLIVRSQNKMEQERVLSQLVEYTATYLPDDISPEDAIKFSTPRMVQLPSELADWSEKVNTSEFESQVREHRSKMRDSLYQSLFEEYGKEKDVEPKDVK